VALHTLILTLALFGQPGEAPPAEPSPRGAPASAPTRSAPGATGTPDSAPAPGTGADAAGELPPELPADLLVGPARPREAWIFIDRWKEFGGQVIRESDTEIELYDGTQRRTFNKGQVLEIVELAQPQPGQQGVIYLRDGSRVRGVILSDDLEGVRFQSDKVVGHLPRHQVYRVALQADFNQRYRIRKALATREEHGRRLALGQWLIEEGRMDLALVELEDLARDSDMEAARDLIRSIRAQMALQQAADAARAAARSKPPAAPRPDGGSGTPGATGTPADSPPAPGPSENATTPVATEPVATPPSGVSAPRSAEPKPPPGSTSLGAPTLRDMLPKDLLTADEVNLIRVYEIDFRDPPALRIEPEGIRQLILRYGSSSLIPATTEERNALYRKPALEVARLLFDLKARDLYRYIEVQEDPPSIARFRTRVHNSWMIPNCATSRCHGGVQAGGFFLYTGNASDARIRYTNLMTLLTYKVDGRPMVNFEVPADSLLIQYAMPRHMARTPHPDVRGWQPVFKTGTPQLLSDTVEWIRGMYQPRPDYPVDYKPPKLDAAKPPMRDVDGPDR
jgi:hypothetical protein